MSERTDNLKPCPFCGGEAEAMELWGHVDMPTAHIACECGASVSVECPQWEPAAKARMKDAMKTAVATWNRRSPPSS